MTKVPTRATRLSVARPRTSPTCQLHASEYIEALAEARQRIWDRDHYSAYHSYPSAENRERLVGLAVAECLSISELHRPPSS